MSKFAQHPVSFLCFFFPDLSNCGYVFSVKFIPLNWVPCFGESLIVVCLIFVFFISRMPDAIFPETLFRKANSNEIAPMRGSPQITFVVTKVQLAWQILQPWQYIRNVFCVDFTCIQTPQNLYISITWPTIPWLCKHEIVQSNNPSYAVSNVGNIQAQEM